MASSLRRQARDRYAVPLDKPREYRRIDDPELAIEVACRNERNNLVALRHGLPGIGSRLVNQFGIEWIVDGHVHVPTIDSLQAWRDGAREIPANLFPSIIPQNFSERLTEFIAAVDRCTSKTFLILDTVPSIKGGTSLPYGNSIDTVSNDGANLVFLDAAHVHETVFAHEIGHAWVQYVEDCEDMRVMKDASEPQRLHQITFVQSFVLDLKVNDVLRRRGFDMSPIESDLALSIESLGRAIDAGYRPQNPREEVFMALTLASKMLDEDRGIGTCLARIETTLDKVNTLDARLAALAKSFADAIRGNGYGSKAAILASVDACLLQAFGHTGDGIDLERDLLIPDAPEPDFDKYPKWLEGAPVALKREVGLIMAKEGVPSDCRLGFAEGGGTTLLTLELADGERKGPFPLANRFPLHNFADVRRIQEINKMNRERMTNKDSSSPMPGRPTSPAGTGVPGGSPVPGASAMLPSTFPPPGFRHYMAGYGRWLTAVREAEWIGGERPYAYASCNPVTYSDPTGHLPQWLRGFGQWCARAICEIGSGVETAVSTASEAGGVHLR